MTTRKKIKENLCNVAYIIKKYNLGDESYFLKINSNSSDSHLKSAWKKGTFHVRNKDIISNPAIIKKDEEIIVNNEVNIFDSNLDLIYKYLTSNISTKNISYTKKKINKRVRHHLAVKFVNLISQETNLLSIKYQKTNWFKIENLYTKHKAIVLIISIICLFFTPRVIDGLTPVDILANRIHENAKLEYRIGAICKDGWKSKATGRGACSHHGGVKNWIYQVEYSKNIFECLKEAHELSWLD